MEEEVFECWLCGAPADNWELTVARVCRSCYADPLGKMRGAGFKIDIADADSNHPTITVTAPRGREPMVGLIFGPQNLRTMITGMFLADVKVGVSRFDHEVHLEFGDKSDVPLLEGVEVEDLIMELVESGIVHLIGDHADIHVKRRHHTDEELALLCGALINAVYERKQVIAEPPR